MHISQARGENVRLYRSFEIKPSPRMNLILGPNAAGKTTFLESLFFAGRGRSFRTADAKELLGASGKAWLLFAEIEHRDRHERVGVGWLGDEQVQHVNGEKVKVAALARVLPLQIIDPTGHRLVEDGPSFRRSYIDWGLFHVEPSFFGSWQRYQRALRQRNQALRCSSPIDVINAWTPEICSAADEVSRFRRAYVESLLGRLKEGVKSLLDTDNVGVEFQQGWSPGLAFRQVLEDQFLQHRRMGSTTQGPHRAELKIWLSGQKAKGRVSRGQQKLLVAALVLAQCTALIDAGYPAPVLLVDDFGAELSSDFQERLSQALMRYPGQVFISAFERPDSMAGAEAAMFHVEHGRLRAS